MIPLRTRRHVLRAGGLVALSATVAGGAAAARPRRILLRSSWQTVNIGDVAHTPGLLATLERELPDVEVTLWPSSVAGGVGEMLRRRFPRLVIAADRAAVDAAFADCDLLLHGSGPSLVAEKDVVRWHDATGKPYGVYGITLPPTPSTATTPASAESLRRTVEVLGGARFVFFRDTPSLDLARTLGCRCPVMGFGPDAAFGTDLRDDAGAEAFLAANGLEPGGYLCCIPRLRYTPYWAIPEKRRVFDPVRHARNEALREHDHAPLREAIVRVVRETGRQVLVCPEDRTQVALGRERIVERLPADVRRAVVWRPDYWLVDEAVSTFVRSAGLFGNEMHSPILCIGNGVPAIVCRFAEQTTKGLMWRDIGLGDWLFDLDDEADVGRIPAAV
ncbi:MAG: polysaccharide pyruvyl transferase family protein, partial [Planctomycetia bacterium]|nr:polysaccharide pyruvyl transferase family protein [Planctomycetia bacterium]